MKRHLGGTLKEEICYLDATQISSSIRDKKFSSQEVAQAFLERIEEINPIINALVAFPDDVVENARQADEAIARGEIWGPLHGVPFTVKDCIDTKGIVTTRGSRLFADRVPDEDATVVERIKDAGGILIGKSNMPEFALWWETDNLVYGRTNNPWNIERTPGGSSGGEAAAIVAGMSPLGIGSDVGGSVREPANYCGIVGLKATHGRIPLTGHWPETLLRFMHVGPLATSIRDISLSFNLMAGADGLASYAIPYSAENGLDSKLDAVNLKIGWCSDGPFGPIDSEVQRTVSEAAKVLSEYGADVEEVSLRTWSEFSPQQISSTIFGVEGAHYLGPFIDGKHGELSHIMQRRLQQPENTLSEYLDALSELDGFRQEVVRYFKSFDLLICPVGPVPAHPHNSRGLHVGDQHVLGRHALNCTVPFDLTGSPALSVPYGWTADGLPIGVQLVGRHFDEVNLLKIGLILESERGANRYRPHNL